MKQRTPEPPRWLDKLVERFCAPHLLEQVMGDLHERFYRRAERVGEDRARRMYLREALAYIRPSVFRRRKSYTIKPSLPDMFTNYFKVGFRNILRKKVYTGINIVGLSAGLACSFFILLWVMDETSFDRFHAGGERIFQVWRHMTTGGQTYTMSSQPRGIADEMEVEFPEVEETVITYTDRQLVVTNGEYNYRENGSYVGETFLQMFSFPLIHGDVTTALHDWKSAVITERTARKIFGDEWDHAVGRNITVDHNVEYTITGIARDVPQNSSIQFDILLPLEEFLVRNKQMTDWWYMTFEIYAKLRRGTSLEEFNTKFADIFNRHTGADDHQIFLRPFEEVYLNSFYRDGELVGGRIEYVRIFAGVGIFILLIASINFMNLATARSSQRAREVGVRKVIGAHRRMLVTQFITESIGMVLLSFVLALLIVVALIPAFNSLTGKHLSPGDLDPAFLLGIIGIAGMVGIVAGSYPALYLSSFNPVAVLRGTYRQGSGVAALLRKGLVVFQFALSVLLIISTVVVYLQLDYIRTKELGLERENLVIIDREGAFRDRFDAVKEELLQQQGIESVTAAGQNPLEVRNNTLSVGWDGKDRDNKQLFYIVNAHHDFVRTMRMELVSGRDFSKVYADSMAYIVNEETANMIGGDVVGKTLTVYGDKGPIVGVVRNFSMNSLYSPIEPVVVRLYLPSARRLYVRTRAGETQEALESLMTVYQKMNPGYPFAYTFLDEQFELRYRNEQVTAKLVNLFAVIALLISCLGLFGLTSFTVEQRTKELGVRRVLGASIGGIVIMLSKDFLKLVFIGVLVAIPVTSYITTRWLQNFSEHISVGVEVFLLAGLASILIALATVSWQSIKAALTNPVDSLRNE